MLGLSTPQQEFAFLRYAQLSALAVIGNAMSQSKNNLAKRAKPVDVISHWPKLIENLRFSSQEFYSRAEKALAERQVPDLKIRRVDWKEGGPQSPRREYLRLQRERLIFDVCGASFGKEFFVSLWCIGGYMSRIKS